MPPKKKRGRKKYQRSADERKSPKQFKKNNVKQRVKKIRCFQDKLREWVIDNANNLIKRDNPTPNHSEMTHLCQLTNRSEYDIKMNIKKVSKNILKAIHPHYRQSQVLPNAKKVALNKSLTKWVIDNGLLLSSQRCHFPTREQYQSLQHKLQCKIKDIRKWVYKHCKKILIDHNFISSECKKILKITKYIKSNIAKLWISNFEIDDTITEEISQLSSMSIPKVKTFVTRDNIMNILHYKKNASKIMHTIISDLLNLNGFITEDQFERLCIESNMEETKLKKIYQYHYDQMLTHNPSKSIFQCNHCDFKNKFELTVRIHEQLPHGYLCSLCPLKFSNQYHLNKHFYSKHEQNASCPFCGLIKSCSEYHWLRHQTLKHSIFCNNFPKCRTGFVRQRDLRYHLLYHCKYESLKKKNEDINVIINDQSLISVNGIGNIDINDDDDEDEQKQVIDQQDYLNKFHVNVTISEIENFNNEIMKILEEYQFNDINISVPQYNILLCESFLKDMNNSLFISKLPLFNVQQIQQLSYIKLKLLFISCDVDIRKSVFNFIDGMNEIRTIESIKETFAFNLNELHQFENYIDCKNRDFVANINLSKSESRPSHIKSFKIFPSVLLTETINVFQGTLPRCIINVRAQNKNYYLDFKYVHFGRIMVNRIYTYWIKDVSIVYCANDISLIIIHHYQSIYFTEMHPMYDESIYRKFKDVYSRIPFEANKYIQKDHCLVAIVNNSLCVHKLLDYFSYVLHPHTLKIEYKNNCDFSFELIKKQLIKTHVNQDTVYYFDDSLSMIYSKSTKGDRILIPFKDKNDLIYKNRHSLRWLTTDTFNQIQNYIQYNLQYFNKLSKVASNRIFFDARIEDIECGNAHFIPLPVRIKFLLFKQIQTLSSKDIYFYSKQTLCDMKYLHLLRCEPEYICCVCNQRKWEDDVLFLKEEQFIYIPIYHIDPLHGYYQQFSPQSVVGQVCKQCHNFIVNKKKSPFIYYGEYGPYLSSVKRLSIFARSNCSNLTTTMKLKRETSKSGRPSFIKKVSQSGYSYQIVKGQYSVDTNQYKLKLGDEDSMFGISVKRIQYSHYRKNLIEKQKNKFKDKINKAKSQSELKCNFCGYMLGRCNDIKSKEFNEFINHLSVCIERSQDLLNLNEALDDLKKYDFVPNQILFNDIKLQLKQQQECDNAQVNTVPIYNGDFIVKNANNNVTVTPFLPDNNTYGSIYDISQYDANINKQKYNGNNVIIGFKYDMNVRITPNDPTFEKHRFNYLYLKGNNTYDKYSHRITLNKYIRQRLNESDNRFRHALEYVLDMNDVIRKRGILSQPFVAVKPSFLNKTSSIYNINAKNILDFKDDIIGDNLNSIKYSPKWWQKKARELTIKMPYIGVCNIFCTITYNPYNEMANTLMRKYKMSLTDIDK